jgi:hypothetical protein
MFLDPDLERAWELSKEYEPQYRQAAFEGCLAGMGIMRSEEGREHGG